MQRLLRLNQKINREEAQDHTTCPQLPHHELGPEYRINNKSQHNTQHNAKTSARLERRWFSYSSICAATPGLIPPLPKNENVSQIAV